MSADDYGDPPDDEWAPEAAAVGAVRSTPALSELLYGELGEPIPIEAADAAGQLISAALTGLADEHIAAWARSQTPGDHEAFVAILPDARLVLHGVLLALAGDPAAKRALNKAAKAQKGLRVAPDTTGPRKARLVALIESGVLASAAISGPDSYQWSAAVRELIEIEPKLAAVSAKRTLSVWKAVTFDSVVATRTAARMSIRLNMFGEGRRCPEGDEGTAFGKAVVLVEKTFWSARKRYPSG